MSSTGLTGAAVGRFTYGGFWLRVGAALIDGIIQSIIGAVVGGVIGGLMGYFMARNGGSQLEIQNTVQIVVQPVAWIIGWLYYAGMESSPYQATVGKRALGLRVTTLTGERISFGRATGRYFAKILSAIILGIGFFMVGWTARNQGLHDKIAGTLVVRGEIANQAQVFQ